MRKKAEFIPNGSNTLLTNSAAPCTIIDLRLWQGFQAVTKSAPLRSPESFGGIVHSQSKPIHELLGRIPPTRRWSSATSHRNSQKN
jgi:hypothetical protein